MLQAARLESSAASPQRMGRAMKRGRPDISAFDFDILCHTLTSMIRHRPASEWMTEARELLGLLTDSTIVDEELITALLDASGARLRREGSNIQWPDDNPE
ncbi:hypothetical protein [Mesorhizobium sp. WSM3224]|uniref:hypothetical protein n=1 Tax=Mesorhizobium sp. WSM3224 TaxID=1040986 RepID=UPI00048A027B|nr:hypothetical protein [Mesorhizobium sp. WSM3224]